MSASRRRSIRRSPRSWATPTRSSRCLLNLLTNAREALTGGGRDLDPDGTRLRAAGRLHFIVTDTGPGIPPTHLPHLFEPFYTTKPSGPGLGLAVSYGIVQSHLGNDRRPFRRRPGRDVHPQLPRAGERSRIRVARCGAQAARPSATPYCRVGSFSGTPRDSTARSWWPTRGARAAPGAGTAPRSPASAPRS